MTPVPKSNSPADSRDNMRRLIKRGLQKWGRAIRNRDGHRCQWCNAPGNQPHHIIPRSACCRLGWFDLRNGVTLCYRCHIHRIKQDPDTYISWRDTWLAGRGLSFDKLRLIFGNRQNKCSNSELATVLGSIK